jgi:inner membrane protein
MDSITQAVLGASIGEATLGHKIGNRGALAGALVATLPDLDVALYAVYSPFEMLSIHRGLSHSILFSVLGALLIAWIMTKMKSFKSLSFIRLFVFSWLALFTHILLDAFTAYGTQLLLPFSNLRVGFNAINVVDPVYTLPMLAGLIWTLRRRSTNSSGGNTIGLIVSNLYLLATLGVHAYVSNKISLDLANDGIFPEQYMAMPVGAASTKWYGVAVTQDSLYLQKYNLLADKKSKFEAFPVNRELLNRLTPEYAEKMKWFSKGFYAVHAHGEEIWVFNLQVDMRGIVELENTKFPTAGYFKFTQNPDGSWNYGSGTVVQP